MNKEEVVTEGDRLCARANRQSEDLGEGRNPTEAAALLGKLRPIVTRALTGFERLRPPEEGLQDFQEYVDALREVETYAPRIQKSVQRRDQKETLRLVEQFEQVEERATQAAARYGFKECKKP